jgi:catechol 2,3-dioxygenase-like lactoylglutathione lyase family enzyme
MIKVADVLYLRVNAPDLDQMEGFLLDFGLHRSARTANALYMRGTDPDHHIHITELGEPGPFSFGFLAAEEGDLEKAAALEGASAIEDIDEPGGGKRVTLHDPVGTKVEIVWGMEQLATLEVPTRKLNKGSKRTRYGTLLRTKTAPARVKRLGHCVAFYADFDRANAWYQHNLGLVPSDTGYGENPDELVIAFLRCDRGERYVDHHTFLPLKADRNALHHAAFEVEDIDEVWLGHEYLKNKGKYTHDFGIGRHYIGSQVYDYWKDPWGHGIEHMTDGDLLNNAHKTENHHISDVLSSQWGVVPPADAVD